MYGWIGKRRMRQSVSENLIKQKRIDPKFTDKLGFLWKIYYRRLKMRLAGVNKMFYIQ